MGRTSRLRGSVIQRAPLRSWARFGHPWASFASLRFSRRVPPGGSRPASAEDPDAGEGPVELRLVGDLADPARPGTTALGRDDELRAAAALATRRDEAVRPGALEDDAHVAVAGHHRRRKVDRDRARRGAA